MWARIPEFKGAFLDGNEMIAHGGLEVAFIGRSNAGKSSLINALFNSKKVARVSQTPGCTKAVMLFQLTERAFLVDLPGYGFNRQSKATQRQWTHAINSYLRYRGSLNHVFLLIDARRGLMPVDETMIEYLWYYRIPHTFIMTKTDKVKPNELSAAEKTLEPYRGQKTTGGCLIKTSSLKKEGLDEVKRAYERYVSSSVEAL